MKKSKLDIPHIKETVVKQLAVGETKRSIANGVGMHHSQISRFAQRDEIQALIEAEQTKLLDCVPDAVENVNRLVREMKDIPKEDTKRMELAYKATKDVLKSVGLLPTANQSQTLININNDNRQQILSPVIQAIIDSKMAEILDDGSDEDVMRDEEYEM